MNDNLKPLDAEEWSQHYNIKDLDKVVNTINSGDVSVWSKELNNICLQGECLEIGCGTGMSSLWLAKQGKCVTALDYTQSSVELVKAAADKLGLRNINIVQCDATKELPFKEKQFDYIFQAGLLEHFETEEQIRMLKCWKRYGKYMISMIPNAASIPYRVGKKTMEDKGIWSYGLEIPKHTFIEEFLKAGIQIEREYTIGTEWAYGFLPKNHYIKKLFIKLEREGYKLDEFMQGYLLVTVGRCE